MHGSATQGIGPPTIGCSPARLCVGKNRIGGSASCEPLFVQRRLRPASYNTSDGIPCGGTHILEARTTAIIAKLPDENQSAADKSLPPLEKGQTERFDETRLKDVTKH
jgi:hypothetical protein